MENNFDSGFSNDIAPPPARPQFLKVLCILSFINCGLMILIYLLGSLTLAINEETAATVMEKALESNPNLQIDNPAEFFQQIGKVCLMALFANIISLLGVIMMWNLNKIGFFIYVVAELSTNFFGLDINSSVEGGKSYGGMIFAITLDVVFIVMYAINLKYMNKNKVTAQA